MESPELTKRPLIIGHRGASGRLPENTLAAFHGALDDGADGIEFDVRMSADGHPIVIHDATLFRTTGEKGRVASMWASDITRLDASRRPAWRNRRDPVPEHFVGTLDVPTLDETLRLLRERNAVGFVEFKGRTARESMQFEEIFDEYLTRYQLHAQAVLLSFDHELLRRVKARNDRIMTAAHFAPRMNRPLISTARMIDRLASIRADFVGLHVSLTTKRRVAALVEHGVRILTWTVNSPVLARRHRALGVDAIVTDFPGRLKDACGSRV